ncbi:hypothetical protein [Alkalilimnicola ehrlichii]|uniref:hypothetical protein n=1 Tax=Alkalilimnicola ehrlichii TaxID=351052 RepID=UPI003BA336D6
MHIYKEALALLSRKEKRRGGLVLGMVVIMAALDKQAAYEDADFLTTLVDLYGFSDRQGRGRQELEAAILCASLQRRPEIQPFYPPTTTETDVLAP